MATPTTAAGRFPVTRLVAGGCLVLVAVGAYSVLPPKSQTSEKPPSTAAKESGTESYPIPSFERPEEAKRYFDAMIQGDTRAIEELDRALAKAREQPDPTPAYVAELERLRAERVERLEAHQRAVPR